MQARYSISLICLPLLGLSACVTQPAPNPVSRLPTYSTDLAGKAAKCTATPVIMADGKEATATITTGGGGWCGIYVRRSDQPFGAGLLVQPPKSGATYVHSVGDDTRVDYTPRPGASGADSFAVKFIPGDALLRVIVNIDAPPVVAAPPPPPAPAKPATPSRARTTTTRTRSTQ